MRILFLSRWYPYPANNGSKIRVYNLLKVLGQHHEVVLVSFNTDAEPVTQERLDGMLEFCSEVHVTPYKMFNPGSMKALLGYLAPKPRSLIDSYSVDMERIIRRAAEQKPFDAVVASQIDMTIYTHFLPNTPRVLEEVEISIFYEQMVRETQPLKKARKQLMWSKWMNYMRGVMRDYDGVTVVSQPEVEPLHRILPGYDRIEVIPNGADLKRFTGDFGTPQPDTLVYTGALTYYVNFDAMKFFLSEVFPLIIAKRPQVKLVMCGTLEGVPVHELSSYPNAEHVGYVSDIRSRVAGSWLSIVPERVGGGTRIKILESMALGTPVIATAHAAKGLQIKDGHDMLVASPPADYAAAVLRVLEDPQLRQTLSQNGRTLIEQKHDWEVIGQQLDSFIQKAVIHRKGVRVR